MKKKNLLHAIGENSNFIKVFGTPLQFWKRKATFTFTYAFDFIKEMIYK